MPQERVILTETTLGVIGTNISILTEYVGPNGASPQYCFISEVVGGEMRNTVPFIEGEGGIQLESGVTPMLNSNGELILAGSNAWKYSIDSTTGNLIYTE